jgi:hypothetical protein
MKSISQIIRHAYEQKVIRKWEYLTWCFDLHDTAIVGKYNKMNAGATIYPYARDVLDFLYTSKFNKTILWTSSYNESIQDILKRFDLKFHYINENPLCSNTEMCDFSKKFYFNLLFDDKSGFQGEYDWLEIKNTLIDIGEWPLWYNQQ